MRQIAALFALVVLTTACGHDVSHQTVPLKDPGDCTAVDIAVTPEAIGVLGAVADDFNGSDAAQLDDGCAFVRVQSIEPWRVTRQLPAGWPTPDRDGPSPAIWMPPSSLWATRLNAALDMNNRRPGPKTGRSFARSPLVVAMPEPMVAALGGRDNISWDDLATAAEQGWGAYGHPEWGAFRFGKSNPLISTPGMLAVMATSSPALEKHVIHYGDSPVTYLENWFRLDRLGKPLAALRYLSGAVTDERSVTAYNAGSPNGVPPKHPRKKLPHTPLVGIRPTGPAYESDYPLIVLNDNVAVRAFRDYALASKAQAKVVKAGFHSGPSTPAPPPPDEATLDRTLADWSSIRHAARVLVLFDVSDSMGDTADPRRTDGPSKLDLAQQALPPAFQQLREEDEVGLRIFTTDLGGGDSPSSDWADLVEMGPYIEQRDRLASAIAGLERQQGSPLYTATRDAFFSFKELSKNAGTIDGVVLVTDGYNEDDRNDDRAALLAQLDESVRVFTIAYSTDADTASLRKIAEATNAHGYVAPISRTIDDVMVRALSNF